MGAGGRGLPGVPPRVRPRRRAPSGRAGERQVPGGQFSRWVHETYPDAGCSLAIEFKKTFMDEWTGQPDRLQMERILRALEGTVPAVLEALRRM